MKEDIFNSYINTLVIYANKYIRDLRCKEYNENELKRKYLEIYYAIFKLYRDILSSLHLDEFGKNNCFRKPTKDEYNEYTCSLNNEKTNFPLNRILEYRQEKFPEYIDDYGMSTFIEFENYEGKIIQIQTNETDWDYELDRIFDVDRLSSLNPQDAYDLLINDIWYKN